VGKKGEKIILATAQQQSPIKPGGPSNANSVISDHIVEVNKKVTI